MILGTVLRTALCLTLTVGGSAAAQVLSASDCAEGGDFIHNAALSRDNGIKAENFVDTLEGDLVRIRAMTPAARWFAYSRSEEDLLRTATHAVFLLPRTAAEHREDFVARCDKLRNSVAYLNDRRSSDRSDAQQDAAQR